jgi:hypothetical protein
MVRKHQYVELVATPGSHAAAFWGVVPYGFFVRRHWHGFSAEFAGWLIPNSFPRPQFTWRLRFG